MDPETYAEALVGIMGFEAVLAGARVTSPTVRKVADLKASFTEAIDRMLRGRCTPAPAYPVNIKRLSDAMADEDLDLSGIDEAHVEDVLIKVQGVRDYLRTKLKTRAPGNLLDDLIAGDDIPTNAKDRLVFAAAAADLEQFIAEIAAGGLDTEMVRDFSACYPRLYEEIKLTALGCLAEVKGLSRKWEPSERTSQQFEILFMSRMPSSAAIKQATDAQQAPGGGDLKLQDDASQAQKLGRDV